MTIKKIFFILVIANIGLLKAQYTAIPDTCFEFHLIDQGIDSEGIQDGQILTSDIENVTELHIEGNNPDISCEITDFTGIEGFSSLEIFDCNYHNVPQLDLIGLTNLKILVCTNNNLKILNVTNNPNLEVLFCATNNLNLLDISQNGALKELTAFQNQITSIDISNNLQIETINLSFNQLSNFISANNTLLNSLSLGVNQLTNININDLTNLNVINCSYNNIQSIEVLNLNYLTTLFLNFNLINNANFSNLPNLEVLGINDNNITNLNLSNLISLNGINCSNNLLTVLDVRNGNNSNFNNFISTNNVNLNCIYVDDATYSTENWLDIDETTTFAETEAECEALVINDLKLNDIILYPNPIKGFLQIKNINNQNIKEIILYNILGNKIIKTNNTFIDFSKFEKGVYFIELIMKNNKTLTKKIIKV